MGILVVLRKTDVGNLRIIVCQQETKRSAIRPARPCSTTSAHLVAASTLSPLFPLQQGKEGSASSAFHCGASHRIEGLRRDEFGLRVRDYTKVGPVEENRQDHCRKEPCSKVHTANVDRVD